MSVTLLTMIASVLVLLAVFTWQPWAEETPGNGIQGGGDPTPVPERHPSR